MIWLITVAIILLLLGLGFLALLIGTLRKLGITWFPW